MDSLLQALPVQEQEGTGRDREGDKATCPGVGQGLDLLLALGTVGSVGPKPQSKDALCFGRDIR